jgi:catechol 2,3-dioxygenase-like lactoylglutathione lyase family enzyme
VKLSAITYVVRDYDEAIRWFVDVLGFELWEDTQLGDTKRWVRVAARGSETCLVLAKAETANQQSSVGKAAGGRVAFFLHVDDFPVTYASLLARSVYFREQPRHETYGMVAVFDDLYGNGWDLIGPAPQLPKH